MDFLQPFGGDGVLKSQCGTVVGFVTKNGKDVTLKIERDNFSGGTCPDEEATFQLKGKLAGVGGVTTMAVWLTVLDDDSNVLKEFERQADVAVDRATGQFTVMLPSNAIITITSLTHVGSKGTHPTPPAAAPFPMPFVDTFDGYPKNGSNIARYFSDMSGGFQVVADPTSGGSGSSSRGGVLKQMTPIIPIGWYQQTADVCPYTVVGSADWANYSAAVDIHLPVASAALGWLGAHIGGNSECDGPAPICSTPWGLYAVIDNSPTLKEANSVAGGWELRLHLRLTEINTPSAAIFKTAISSGSTNGGWVRVELTLHGARATVRINNKLVASNVDVSGPLVAPGASKSFLPPAGWAGLGGGRDYSTDLYFDNFSVTPVETATLPSSATPAGASVSKCAANVQAGMPVVGVPCGLDVPGIAWDLTPVPGSPPNASSSGAKVVTVSLRTDPTLCVARAGTALVLSLCNASEPAQVFNYSRLHATIASGVRPGGGGGGKPVSPWQTFTPGQGMAYGNTFGHGSIVTVIRHLPQHQEAETLEFLVDGKSQGAVTMPLDLPEDVVGCVGMCSIGGGSASISAVAPATFATAASGHGPDVTVDSAGGVATWPANGCNQIAVVNPNSTSVANPSYTVKINDATTGSADAAVFIDIGWCSRGLDPTGKEWPAGPPGPAEAHWMGEQGIALDWIYRSGGEFKASTNGTGGSARIEDAWCLPPDDDFNRGDVRPWEPATIGKCNALPGTAGVHWDVELGALYADVNTAAQLCFGVC